jgi:hypothetical protein
VLRDAAEQEIGDHAGTVLADDDQIAARLLLLFDDRERGVLHEQAGLPLTRPQASRSRCLFHPRPGELPRLCAVPFNASRVDAGQLHAAIKLHLVSVQQHQPKHASRTRGASSSRPLRSARLFGPSAGQLLRSRAANPPRQLP